MNRRNRLCLLAYEMSIKIEEEGLTEENRILGHIIHQEMQKEIRLGLLKGEGK